jgi:hypothetical protein
MKTWVLTTVLLAVAVPTAVFGIFFADASAGLIRRFVRRVPGWMCVGLDMRLIDSPSYLHVLRGVGAIALVMVVMIVLGLWQHAR